MSEEVGSIMQSLDRSPVMTCRNYFKSHTSVRMEMKENIRFLFSSCRFITSHHADSISFCFVLEKVDIMWTPLNCSFDATENNH